MVFFSQREFGPPPRNSEELTLSVWRAIIAAVERRVRDGSFGNSFPKTCPEYDYPVGTDAAMFGHTLSGAVPEVGWPLNEDQIPLRFGALDLVQFCYANVSKPQRAAWHDYFRHYRLTFNIEAGRQEFRAEINAIFERHGLVFELREDGGLVRLGAPELQAALDAAVFNTGDDELNRLLAAARTKFKSPDIEVRREALERLWDAWERLKTLEDPTDKRRSVNILLDRSASNARFRELLELEANNLTKVGNDFMIRHTEVGKIPLDSSEQVDFLFHLLFALTHLTLRLTQRLA
jgi:hypothetical protein